MTISVSHLFDMLRDIFHEWNITLKEADITKFYKAKLFRVDFVYLKDNQLHETVVVITFDELLNTASVRGMGFDSVFVALMVQKLKEELNNE